MSNNHSTSLGTAAASLTHPQQQSKNRTQQEQQQSLNAHQSQNLIQQEQQFRTSNPVVTDAPCATNSWDSKKLSSSSAAAAAAARRGSSPPSTPIDSLKTPLMVDVSRDPLVGESFEATERELGQVYQSEGMVSRSWMGSGSVKASIFNLTNATLGAGIVSVPYAFMHLGLALSSAAVCLFALASYEATKLLVTVLDFTGALSFELMAEAVSGPSLSFFVLLILLLFNFGAAVGYLICIADIYAVLVHAYEISHLIPAPLHFILHKFTFLTIITLCVCLPLSLVNKMSKIRMASLLGLIAMETLVLASFILFIKKGIHPSLGSLPFSKGFVPMGTQSIRGIPLLVFAFACHSNAPLVYNELENQSYRRMAKVSRRSVITALITYSVMGFSGFLIFGYSTKPNILSNFVDDVNSSVLFLIVLINILIGIILSFPMCLFPCRTSVENLYYRMNPTGLFTKAHSNYATAGLAVLALFIALIVPSLTFVFSLIGSICGACITFIFPGMFVLLLPFGISENRKSKAKTLVVFGSLIAVFGTLVSLSEIRYPQ